MNEKGTYNLIKLSWTFYYVRSQLIVEDKRTQAYLTMEVECLLHSYTFYKDFLLFFVFIKVKILARWIWISFFIFDFVLLGIICARNLCFFFQFKRRRERLIFSCSPTFCANLRSRFWRNFFMAGKKLRKYKQKGR